MIPCCVTLLRWQTWSLVVAKQLAESEKKDVNWDSHIASSPISQSSFFEEVRCLILVSSQRKLRGHIEFFKFSIKHHLVLVYLRRKFQLYKSKFAWVRQIWENSQKIKSLKKFERFNRFWLNSIPKFLDRYNIFVCSFTTKSRILRKFELPRPF